MQAAALAIAVLQFLPSAITASEEVLGLISTTVASLKAMQAEGRDPTPAEWDSIHAIIETLRGAL